MSDSQSLPSPPPSRPVPPARAPLGRRKLWAFRLLALALAFGFAFLALEVAVRLLVQQPFGSIEDLRRFRNVQQTGKRLTLINLVRPSDNPALVYQMIPGVEGNFWGGPVRINKSGYHDHDRAVAKPPGTFRLIAVGDSVLFGWGVPMDERFSSLLETFLNETATPPAPAQAPRFEVLNFGVPGYNTRMEAEVLRAHAAGYSPDAVLVAFTPDNDAKLPNFVVKPRNRLSLRRTYLLDAVRGRGIQGIRQGAQPGLKAANSDDVPEEYRFLDGEDAMVAGMRQIRHDARSSSIPLLLMPYFFNPDQLDAEGQVTSAAPPSGPEFARKALDQARELNYTVVDPSRAVGQYLGRQRLTWEDLQLDLARGDSHPNLPYHALLARELYRAMVEENILPDAAARRARLDRDLQHWDRIIEQAWEKLRTRRQAESTP